MTTDVVRLVVGPDQSDNGHLGVLLHELRSRADLSRRDAAMYIGVSPEYVRLMERGLRVPAAGTMRLILQSYEIPYEMQISDDGNAVIVLPGYCIEFTSRIQEARYKIPELRRDELLGRIVNLLPSAEKSTLIDIYNKLR